MKKVLLISMPFNTITFPSLGISLLKSAVCAQSFPCDVRYFNIEFASRVGVGLYERIWLFRLGGERLFSEEYFGDQLPDKGEFMSYLRGLHPESTKLFGTLMRDKKFVKDFLDDCFAAVSWEDYNIVGFSNMCDQNLSSICLARMVKISYPDVTVIFGGTNCDGDMGVELHRQFDCIDYVCVGESDISFPALVRGIAEGRQPVDDLPGVVFRRGGETVMKGCSQKVTDLDSLPFADYDDYFLQLKEKSLPLSICSWLPMETSRGCWWGEKAKCTFCGLNNETIAFRRKSSARVLKELEYNLYYIEKFQVPRIFMVDNILSPDYFKDLIPQLITKRLTFPFFFEIKANLKKEQLAMLRAAGVTWVQPGIESFNTEILARMSKGVSGLQNIQLLKHFEQLGIYASWNLLTGFPGEKPNEIEQIENLIPKIIHLQPPTEPGRFSLHKFSPYFQKPEQYGLINVRPGTGYRLIYPFQKESLARLAYYFEFDYREDLKPPDYEKKMHMMVDFWMKSYANNATFYAVQISASCLLLIDRRPNTAAPQLLLTKAEKDIYEYCDQIRSFDNIFSYIRDKYRSYPIRERDVSSFLNEMVNLNLVVREHDKYLSLAIFPSD